MPIHPVVASKFHLLEGIESFEAGLADPDRARGWTSSCRSPTRRCRPTVEVRDDAAPGPHGPVPVRIYPPADGGADLPCLVWLHGGAFRMGDLDMPEADWTARQICDAGRRRRRQRRLPALRRRRDLPGAARRRRGRRPLGARQRRRPGHRPPTGSRSAAPAPAATSPPAPRCGCGTTTAGCRPRCCSPTRRSTPSSRRRRPSLAPLLAEIPRLLRFLPEDRRRHHRELPRRPAEPRRRLRDAGATPCSTGSARCCCSTPSTTTCAPRARCSPRSSRVAGVDVRQVTGPRHAARLPEPARGDRAGRPRAGPDGRRRRDGPLPETLENPA